MTIATDKNRNEYTGTGSQTTFAYEFKIWDKTELKVYVAGVLQTVDVHYTVTGVGLSTGGNVVFGASYIPANGSSIVLLRQLPYTQGLDLEEGGVHSAETIEARLDKITVLTQQLKEVIARAPKFVEYSLLKNIPLADLEAGKYLRGNLAGNGLEFTAAMYELGMFLQSGSGAVLRTAASKMGEIVSVKDFGTNEAAVQAAFSDGGIRFLPKGIYEISTGIIGPLDKPLILIGEGEESILTGHGIAILTMRYPFILEKIKIVADESDADTIALDINYESFGVNNFVLRDVILKGFFQEPLYVGIGIRFIHALKGFLDNCNVEWWNKGLDLNAYNGGGKSNANLIKASKIRDNNIGIYVASDGSDDVWIDGSTIEGNKNYGVQALDGVIAVHKSHFENLEVDNIRLSGSARYRGRDNFFSGESPGYAINILSDDQDHLSDGDHFTYINNSGEAPGRFVIRNPRGLNTVTGNGTTIIRSDGTRNVTFTPYNLGIVESGRSFNNGAATEDIEFNLPAAVPGLEYSFTCTSAASNLLIDPYDTNVIRGGGAGQYLSLNTIGNSVTLRCYIAGTWEIVAGYGTPAFEE